MKVLCCAVSAYGHVFPILSVAAAARAAGHDVEVATAGSFVARCAALGYRTHGIGVTVDDAAAALTAELSTAAIPADEDGRPDTAIAGRLFIDLIARPTAADLGRALPAIRPDLVIYDQSDLGAAVAAHVAGIPAVALALSPRWPDDELRTYAGDRIERLWADLEGRASTFDVFTGDAHLDPFPNVLQEPSFLDHPARVRMRPIPFADPNASLPGWLGSLERPLVYLTLGTIVATDDHLRPAVEGLAALDADVLVALGSASGGGLGPVPENVHLEAFVDQPAVLGRADLAVHHSGSGTLLGALVHGTPQLLLPKGTDQFVQADRMSAAGLAPVLEPSAATAAAIATLAHAELATRRPAVAAVRDELAGLPHPVDVVDEIVARFT